ncbi:MAG: hypothetical protein Q8P41_28665 [Pseudomonadota bacterium]|nr:hypothetical protein [Pseudomonadota bacterium]
MLFLLLALACTDDPATCGTGGAPASLTVTFDVPDLDWTSKPKVRVYDADATFVADLSPGESVLEDLAPGPYTLVTVRATAPSTPGGEGGDPSFSEVAYGRLTDTVEVVCVAGDAAATVSYALQPSSGHLFVSSGERIAGFAAADLVGGGDALTADISLDLSLVNGLHAFHFDPLGNLWAATEATYGARFLVFEPGSVSGVGAVEPDYELAVPEFADNDRLTDFAFADDGSLWVSVAHDDTSFVGLYHFSTAQGFAALRGEEVAAPAETYTVAGLLTPDDLVIDGGALWIADFDQDAVVRVEVGAAGGTTLTPTHTVSVFHDAKLTTPFRGPTDLLLDAEGGLWVNWWTDAALTRLLVPRDGAQLPDSVYQPDSLALVAGLAGDLGGGLWYGQEGATGALHRVIGGSVSATHTTAETPVPTDLVVDPAP